MTSAGFALLHPGDVVGVPPAGGMGRGNCHHFNFAGSVVTEREFAHALSAHVATTFQQTGGAIPLNV